MVYAPNERASVDTVEQLRDYVRDELRALARESSETIALDLRTISIEPKRPRQGMIIHADGVSWDPGYGIGPYIYQGGLWLPLANRPRLVADRTYYVRTDGSDSNTGLANTAGGAFLTIQKAIDVAVSLDLSIYQITIQIQNATWTTELVLKSYIGVGPITILGDSGVPTAGTYLISTAGNAVTANGVLGRWVLSGLELRSTGGSGLYVIGGSKVAIKNLRWGATGVAGNQVAGGGSLITNTQPDGTTAAAFAISGNMQYFWNVDQQAQAYMVLATITLTGTPNFPSGSFIDCNNGSGAYLVSNTYTGAATGKRYSVTFNAWVQTFGATLPGNVAGTTATQGLYA